MEYEKIITISLMDKANSEDNVTKADRTTRLIQDSHLTNKRIIANGKNGDLETTTIGNTTFSKKVQKSSRNIGQFCFTRSASSPAMLNVESGRKLGVRSNNGINDSEIKGERDERKTGWKTERKHVSFDECVHVLTKCSVIKLPLKNSTRTEANSRANDEHCDGCTRSCLRKRGNLTVTKTVSFGLDETLRTAVLQHDLSEVERLCQQWDINFNKKLSNGLTLLHLSSIQGCFRVVQYILKHGGRVDEPDDQGWTALHYAALHGNVPCALALLRGGADINWRTWDYHTAMELASEDEMILLLGRLMNGGLGKADKANQNKETYV